MKQNFMYLAKHISVEYNTETYPSRSCLYINQIWNTRRYENLITHLASVLLQHTIPYMKKKSECYNITSQFHFRRYQRRTLVR